MKNIIMSFMFILLSFVYVGCVNENAPENNDGEIPELINQLDSHKYDTRIYALKELVSLGNDAIPQLTEASRDQWPNMRYYALRALGEIGPDALPIMFDNLANAFSPSERGEIYSLMRYISWDPVPGLINTIETGDADIRMYAYDALPQIPTIVRSAIPLLFVGLEIEEDVRKLGPAAVLAYMELEGCDVIPKLVGYLNHEDEWVRCAAAYAFRIIGPEAEDAAVDLQRYLQDWSCEVGSAYAASALSQIDPTYLDGLTAKYLDCLESDDAKIRQNAASTLGGFFNQSGVLPALIKALEDEDDIVRNYAAGSLGEIGKDGGEEAVNALIDALGNEEFAHTRWVIVKDLGKHGPLPDVVDALRKALKDNVAGIREEAAKVLTSFGPNAKVAIPDLIEALKEESALASPEVAEIEIPVARKFYANALGAIGPEAEEAFSALVTDGYRSRDGELRVAAAVAMHKIDPNQLNVVDLLVDELDNRSPLVRAAAAEALGELGAEAAAALPELRIIAEIDDPDPICINFVENAAREAILKIEGV